VKGILVIVLALAPLLSGCAATGSGGVEVRDAWVRPAAQGRNGAVYFALENHSSQTQELIGVASDIADAVEIHESKMSGDVMEMHQLESVSLAPGTEVKFEPGGLHMMLIGLKKELKNGDEIDITLQFKNLEDLLVPIPVRDAPSHEGSH
jgi:periplasmic copper chaperone A